MRVGVIGPMDPDSFADNIADCLPDLGVEVVRLGPVRRHLPGRLDQGMDLLLRAEPGLDARLQRPLARRALDAGCDVVISVSAALMPETVSLMKGGGIRTALWFPDHVANLDRQLMFIADYDRLYFKDSVLVERIRSLTGLPVAYLAEACNPHWHFPQGMAGRDREIVVAGNMYPTRVRLLDRLHADGIPLRLYGNPFPKWIPQRPVMTRHTGKFIVRKEKAAVFRAAAGVLNNLHPSELSSVNKRLFEATGCGAAVLCEDRPALRAHFDVDQEVLAFSTYEELRSHCLSLLADVKLVNRIGDAGARRTHAEHTNQLRLATILEDCAP